MNNQHIRIIGNNKYVIINYSLYHLKKTNNNKLLTSSDSVFSLYTLPIIRYNQDECCVCMINQGTLIGLCGHQNICSECINKLSTCPICKNKNIINTFDSQILNYINLF